ncbi:MAG TPA: hypothetical protein PLO63_10320 [Syntrophales bacterium]|nr:hypothetical protein [Syntrophales bacterium]
MSDEPSDQLPTNGPNRLLLTVKAEFVPFFFPLLQKGFVQKTEVGCSLRELLAERFGVPAEYIENRIQTVFLDGKPVDDMDAAVVRDGAVLALSSAMPGLLGAIMRKGGYYSRMRSPIGQGTGGDAQRRADGQVVVKLFNLTVRELGPLFLERGIRIDPEDLKNLFRNRPEALEEGCVEAAADGRRVDPAQLPALDFPGTQVYLKLRTA